MSLDHLNENQAKAVTLPLGPSLIIAGPGSGKTHVIIHRIDYMITQMNAQPSQILVITFTKAAAEEMKTRYQKKFGNHSVTFGTFHSAFFRILRTYNADKYHLEHLLSEETKKKVIEDIYKKMTCEKDEDFLELFLKHLTLMRNQLIHPKYYNPDGLSKEVFLQAYFEYERFKENHEKFDFDDMLVDCYAVLKNDTNLLHHFRKKYHYLLIDEFQDVNLVQFEVVKLLAGEQENVFVVGDDDQSIYKFRGSKPELLFSFKAHFNHCQEVILDINYRSTKKILSYSNALIVHNKKRYNKVMKTTNDEGDTPHIIKLEDVKEQSSFILNKVLEFKEKGIKWSDCAIIYRTNIEARPLLEVFLAAHIPFYLRDSISTLYDSWLTKDILAYLKVAGGMQNNDLVTRIINRPSRYMSKICLEQAKAKEGNLLIELLKLEELSQWQKNPIEELLYHLQALKKLPIAQGIAYIRSRIGYDKYVTEYAGYRHIPPTGLFELLDELQASAETFESWEAWEEHLYQLSLSIKQNNQDKENKEKGLTLTTMHSAKGLEFKIVFILDAVDGVTPHSKSLSEAEIEEERRLFYVALTRAKEKLFICVPKMRYNKKTIVSAFIEEMCVIDLKEGTKIIHKKYGKGIIIRRENQKITLQLENGSTKLLDATFCLKNHMITVEE